MRIQEQAFRFYTDNEHFEEMIRFYEGLQDIACERRVSRTASSLSISKPIMRSAESRG
jgi:hypothetical protein